MFHLWLQMFTKKGTGKAFFISSRGQVTKRGTSIDTINQNGKKSSISKTIKSPMVWCAKLKTAVTGIDSTIIFPLFFTKTKKALFWQGENGELNRKWSLFLWSPQNNYLVSSSQRFVFLNETLTVASCSHWHRKKRLPSKCSSLGKKTKHFRND